MRKTSTPNKLNHKLQGVCEDNKKELEEKNDCLLKILWLKDQLWKPVEEQ